MPSLPEWWVHRYPFRHFRAQSILDPESYGRVCSAFREILEITAGERKGVYRLKQSNPKYDANMLGMSDDLAPSFDPFFSWPWLQSLYRLVGLPEVPRIDGGLHSSAQGSRDGWIHSDLCSGWFDESPGWQGVFPNREKCDYFSGQTRSKDAKPVEYVRAATMIFYLCNEGWSQGDGGETGLYGSSRIGSHTPVDLLPPVDNSILLFECSPHSYHRFVTNPGRTRNSIILWLHTRTEQAEAMWGNAIHRRKPS